MTWTKLGDEFLPAAAELTDAEYRTHVEALIWSSWRLLDLRILKGDVKRFAESPDVVAAIDGLLAKGWWEDRGDAWYIGMHWPEWQQTSDRVKNRKAYLTEAKRRSRAHLKGDHSLCLPDCGKSTVPSTVDPGRDGNVFPAPQGREKTSVPRSTVDRTRGTPRGKRTAAEEKAEEKKQIAEFLEWAKKQPPCSHDWPGGDQIRPDDVAVCPHCRHAPANAPTRRGRT